MNTKIVLKTGVTMTIQTKTILSNLMYNFPNWEGVRWPEEREVFHYYVLSKQVNGPETYNPDQDFGFLGSTHFYFKFETSQGPVFLHKFKNFNRQILEDFVQNRLDQLFINTHTLQLIQDSEIKIYPKDEQIHCRFEVFFRRAEFIN